MEDDSAAWVSELEDLLTEMASDLTSRNKWIHSSYYEDWLPEAGDPGWQRARLGGNDDHDALDVEEVRQLTARIRESTFQLWKLQDQHLAAFGLSTTQGVDGDSDHAERTR